MITKKLEEGDFFGLHNMLFMLNRYGGFPAETNYISCDSDTKILAIHVLDFLHVMQKEKIEALMYKHGVHSLKMKKN